MTSTVFTSGTVVASAWLNDANTMTYKDHLNVKMAPYNAVGDGVTDDYAAFAAATAVAAAAGLGVFIPAGTYKLGTKWSITNAGMRITAFGKVVLSFTNSGNCVEVNGDSAAATYIYDVHFGTKENPIFINGNATTTNALLWRASHHGSASFKAWNCITGLRTEFAVCNDFYPTVTISERISQVLTPTYGWYADRRNAGEESADNTIYLPILEGITTGVGRGIHLEYSDSNKVIGGTSEGNKVGLFAGPNADRDNIIGLYTEVNTQNGFDIGGSLITLTDCNTGTGAPTPSDTYCSFRSTAVDCRVVGGDIAGITIDSGATRTQLIGIAHSSGAIVTDNGTDTLVVQGPGASKFPKGLQVGGGTATITKYEAGTFTPTITATSGVPTAYTTQGGTYYQLGNWVHFSAMVQITGKNTLSGPITIDVSGLPLSASSSAGQLYSVTIGQIGATTITAGYQVTARMLAGGKKVELYQSGNGVASAQLTDANLPAGTWYIVLTGAYKST